LKNRETLLSEKICKILPNLLSDEPIPATFGYFFIHDIVLKCQLLLEHLEDYERTLGKARCKKLKSLCEREEIVVSGEIEEELGIKTKNLALLLVKPHPECFESGIAHVYLFTKNLLNMRGGRMFDPTGRDGLYTDLKNARKFYESILELRKWETDKLWDSVWEPLGGQPSDEKIEIPEEKIPFEIEDIVWTWNWMNNLGETVYGYLIDIRDLTVKNSETVEELEKRIDQAIKPIKKYLSKKRPNLSYWWG
jgi:hypothetical protein